MMSLTQLYSLHANFQAKGSSTGTFIIKLHLKEDCIFQERAAQLPVSTKKAERGEKK